MRNKELEKLKEYKYGFTTDIESIKAPKGLNKEVIEFIRKKKGNPVLAMVLINKKADDEIEEVPLRALIRARPVRN